ncbi:ester cyclase [Kutzneria sp. NPDC052558]|uniref:ester cyclase n=1 Tax=Kutzneria sp. NPDC052558 TaxID=3364121 RepID=UPI0037CB857D
MNIRSVALVAAVVGLVGGGTALSAQAQPTSLPGADSARVNANELVVAAFMADVLNGHHGDHATRYLTPDMQWHGGTVGTVAGASNVAGLMTTVVTSIPDLHAAVEDVVAQGDEVVVRLVVTGTQKGDLLGIPASDRPVRWDATDLYRLKDGKISEEWAAEDFTAFLYGTGAYKAPWIP